MNEEQKVELKLIHMEEVVSKEVSWLWYPYIPYGKITVIEGDPGEGKKALVLKLAAMLSKGLPLPCDDDRPYEPIHKEYMIKGFAMDDERLKQGKTAFGKDYFKELLERVRSIRASERRIWQQITDIFAECSIDYDKDSQTTHDFYAMVQNKFHYAITGQTAAEIIDTKADHTKEHMGLTTWKNSPDGRILKSDVTIAKNYLDEKQIRQLERAVTGYFDYIEDLIERENTFTMTEFAASINEFLAFRKYDVLEGKGRISKKTADRKAVSEYVEFNKTQKIVSDFDKEVKKMLQGGEGGNE